MRPIMTLGLAAALMILPAGAFATAGTVAQKDAASELSAAKKKRTAKRQAAPKEQYLRAVPSTPPAGTKQ